MLRFDEESEKWFYRFKQKFGQCSAKECWARYQSIVNWRKPKHDTVSVHNQQNIEVSCIPCETKEKCPIVINLPTFLPSDTVRAAGNAEDGGNKTTGIKRTKSQADIEKFMEQMGVELPGVNPASLIISKPPGKSMDEDEIVEGHVQDPKGEDSKASIEPPEDERALWNSRGQGRMTHYGPNRLMPLDLWRFTTTTTSQGENSGEPISKETPEKPISHAWRFTTTTTTTTEEEVEPISKVGNVGVAAVEHMFTEEVEPISEIVVKPIEPNRACKESQLPKACIIEPGPKGDEWQEQMRKNTDCKGNVLVIKMKGPSTMQMYQYMNYRPVTIMGVPMAKPKMDQQEFYIGLQVDSTHDITDLSRTIPSGLSISLEGNLQRKLVVEHKRLPIDVTVLAKAGDGGGLLALLDGVVTQHFQFTNKLVIKTTYGSQATWEQIKPPSLSRSLAQGVLGVGAWFGAKSILPSSWVETVEYLPSEKGSCELAPATWLAHCKHSSAANVDEVDQADQIPEHEDSDDDDDDDDWRRDFVDDDEEGDNAVGGGNEDTGPTETQDSQDMASDEEDNSDSGWEYEPHYEGFNGDGDGGFGLYG